MNKELCQILHLLEKMKKNTKIRGLGLKKFKEGYKSIIEFKKEIKSLNSTLYIAQSAILNDKQIISRTINYMRIHLIYFIDYISDIQDLVKIFLSDTINRHIKLKKYFIVAKKSTTFINKIEEIIAILEKITKDMQIPYISSQNAQKGRNDLLCLQNNIEELKKEIREAQTINFYTHELADHIAYCINIRLGEIVKKLEYIQSLVWHSLGVHIDYCEEAQEAVNCIDN